MAQEDGLIEDVDQLQGMLRGSACQVSEYTSRCNTITLHSVQTVKEHALRRSSDRDDQLWLAISSCRLKMVGPRLLDEHQSTSCGKMNGLNTFAATLQKCRLAASSCVFYQHSGPKPEMKTCWASRGSATCYSSRACLRHSGSSFQAMIASATAANPLLHDLPNGSEGIDAFSTRKCKLEWRTVTKA